MRTGTEKDVMDLVAWLRDCEPWGRSARVVVSRFGILTIRAAQKRGYIERHGQHKHWGRFDDHYTFGRAAYGMERAAE